MSSGICSVRNLIHISITILIVNFCCGSLFPMSEVDLSDFQLTECQCAYEEDPNPCKDLYKDWFLISNGYIQRFNNSKEKRNLQDISDNSSCGSIGNGGNFCSTIDTLQNGIILSTGGQISLSYPLENKKKIIICPGSLAPVLKEIKFSNILEVYIAPEAIAERFQSLNLEFKNIKNDLVFPTGFYDYQYIFQHELNEADRNVNTSENKDASLFEINLEHVGIVTFASFSVKAGGLKLKMNNGKKLQIEESSIVVKALNSGLAIHHVDFVDLKHTWGNYLYAEFCKNVQFFSNTFPSSIDKLHLNNIKKLVHYENSVNFKTNFNVRVEFVESWILYNTTIESIRRDFYGLNTNVEDLQRNNSRTRTIERNLNSKLVIKTVNLHVVGRSFIKAIVNDLLISNVTFTRPRGSNASVFFAGNLIKLFNTTIPDWVQICQLNASAQCKKAKMQNDCPFGYPFSVATNEYFSEKCENTNSATTSDTWSHIAYCLLALGILSLVGLTLVAAFFIYRHKKLSGRWHPEQLIVSDIPTLETSSRITRHSQVLHVPTSDSQISFTFPRHLSGRISPFNSRELSAVNFYSDEDYKETREVTQSANVNSKDEAPVQLLNVKSCVDEFLESGFQDWKEHESAEEEEESGWNSCSEVSNEFKSEERF